MKGQSSVEYLLIVAAFLVILSTFTIPNMVNPVRDASQNVMVGSQAKSACDKISNTMNGASSSTPIYVSFSDNWTLKIETDPPKLKIGIQGEGETIWVDGSLQYGFNSSLPSIPAGSYFVIVERGDNEGISKSENKISIKLNPSSGGGQWRN